MKNEQDNMTHKLTIYMPAALAERLRVAAGKMETKHANV